MATKVQAAMDLAERLEAIIAHPEKILDLKDNAIRRRLREAGRKLSHAMEDSGDTTHRIANAPLQTATARIGIEKGIFDKLVEAGAQGSTLSNDELAQKTDIDPVLLKRLLRYYQSFDMILQSGDDAYTANNVTKGLTTLGGRSGISYFFEMISASFMAFPRFLRENNYANPTDPAHLPWHLGHNTELCPFPWLQANPQYMDFFLPWMATQRDGLPIFLDVLDFPKEFLQGPVSDDETPIFVDVGGALGHQCLALREKYPELKGRVILQDQDYIVKQVESNPLPGFKNVEVMAYDFFTPQPIIGARAYYLRNCLHDWPDHKCKDILSNVKSGMTENSVLLIDEAVLSERGAPWRAAQLDLAMVTCLAAKERTEAEWKALLEAAGFSIQRIWKYTDECEDCVIVAVPQSA